MWEWVIDAVGGPDYAQVLVGLMSVVTAGVAVIIALWTGYINRQNARYSVEPALSIWADYPGGDNDVCEVRISNKGFGPAIIESFAVFNDGTLVGGPMYKKVENLIESAFTGVLDKIDYVSSLERGHALGSGDEEVIARFTVSPGLTRCGVESMAQLMLPISLVIRYRDIYHRRWAFAVHEFDSYTFRDVWWSLSYQKARRRLESIMDIPHGPIEDLKAN